MNKIAIIAGLSGLVVGAAGGYFACHIIEQKRLIKRFLMESKVHSMRLEQDKEKKLWKMRKERQT